MEHRSLAFKYWISFDDEGEIKSFYKSKYDSKEPCQEFIVRLIPIERDVNAEINRAVDEVEHEAKKTQNSLKNLDTEFKKVIKGFKGVLK